MASLTSARSLRSSLSYTTSVASLFAAGEVGLWFDTTDITTLYQDTAGTIPITATGQTVALMKDKSGRNNHATQPTAAQRPTYGVIPYGGIRNFANGSGAVGDVTYWPATATQSGVTATKVASGTDTDGLPYVDIRYQGTSTNTFHTTTYALDQSRTNTATGTTWTTSYYIRQISGSTVGVTGLRAAVREETSPNTLVGITDGTPNLGATETLVSVSRSIVSGNQVSGIVSFAFSSGATIDITYRIKGLQLEKASSRSSSQLNLNKYNVTEAGKASLGVLYPDGIDDWMVTPSINFSGTNKMTVWAGLQKMSDAARGMLVELGNLSAGAVKLEAPPASPLNGFGFSSGGSIAVAITASGYPAPNVSILTGIGDISGDVATLMVNNVVAATSAADQGTGNYSNNPIYLFRRGGASLPFNGPFTGLIVRGAASSAAQISLGNGALNAKLGAY